MEETIQPESLADDMTDTIETAPEAPDVKKTEKWTKEYAEQVVRNIFGEDISEERLNYFTKGMYEESEVSETETVPVPETSEEVIDIAETATEEPEENSSVTENIQSETSSDNMTEIPTEEVAVIPEIQVPIKAPAQKAEKFTITDEMRKNIFKDLFGHDLSDEQLEAKRTEQINQCRNQAYTVLGNRLCIA
ncbi:MAG: hypothetical protein K2J39_06240 [Ruminococcus sp.]|nr:hypothetical protein [Ruminococcus sp.]